MNSTFSAFVKPISVAILALAALSGLSVVSCTKPQADTPEEQVDTLIHIDYEVDTLKFAPSEVKTVAVNCNRIFNVVFLSKPFGWKAVLNEDYSLTITAPEEGSTGVWQGNVGVRATADDGTGLKRYIFVTLDNPRQMSHSSVLFMGDSLTDLWDNSEGDPSFFTTNKYTNVGVSGETTNDMLKRFETSVINKHPDIMVLLAGTNDIAQNDGYYESDTVILNNLKKMCDMARDDGAKVLLCSILPCKYFYWNPSMQPQERIATLNPKIKALVQKEGYDGYVDYYTSLAAEDGGMISDYTNDGCHPNYYCYTTVMEPIITAAIESLK